MLPSKTILEASNRKGPTHTLKPKVTAKAMAPPKKKTRTHSIEVEEIEDEDSSCNIAAWNGSILSMSSFQIPNSKKKGNTKWSPIYLFYKIVVNRLDGTLGDDRDIHYCCLHGAHKIFLVNNLCVHVKPMYQLYCILKDCDRPPTPDEINIASGKRELDGHAEAKYLKKLNKASENIKKAFGDQKAWAAGPWDQEKFEQLLTKWIIACNQPFDEVEKPEFITMMNFTHCNVGSLKIPKHDAIKQHVMRMGEETIEGVCKMFLVQSCLVSLV
ncbi:hypothetical protein BYT27DRAFT_7285979 [Phlegmacium glaucopus]|nr:hypothetical protein BYT27DRAFT_7285979 [Phlegmacium glaucopus]